MRHPSSISGTRAWRFALRAVIFAAALGFVMPIAKAEIFSWDPLPAESISALSPEARTLYQQGVQSLDHINYDDALENIGKAVEKAPDDMHLRFLLVQIARFRGNSTFGADSIKYYDTAISNLRMMALSDKLNIREQARAQKSLQDVTTLRSSVAVRDEKRVQYGRGIAKQYAATSMAKTPEEQKQAKAEAQRQADIAQGKFVLPTPEDAAAAAKASQVHTTPDVGGPAINGAVPLSTTPAPKIEPGGQEVTKPDLSKPLPPPVTGTASAQTVSNAAAAVAAGGVPTATGAMTLPPPPKADAVPLPPATPVQGNPTTPPATAKVPGDGSQPLAINPVKAGATTPGVPEAKFENNATTGTAQK